ncbi:MAG: SIMPL domain-containing protein [Clostridiales bacterium]|jgi:uncharacterized protein YggE|nr:SIMPL domain-containing protein [Clostridiales bacterium]
MKKLIFSKMGIALLGLAFTLAASACASNGYAATEASGVSNAAGSASSSEARKIIVTGTGSVNVKPDIAYIDIGVSTQNSDAKAAQNENSASMDKVIAAIKSLGVAEKDIQTTSFSIYPQYDYRENDGTQKITGYQVVNQVRVTVRDISKTGELLGKVIDAGANYGGGIQFSIEDSSEAYAQAMDGAIKGAKSKAEAIAKSLGVSVGAPIEVLEQGGTYKPVNYFGNSNDLVAMRDNSIAESASIQTGDLLISADIQVVFTY